MISLAVFAKTDPPACPPPPSPPQQAEAQALMKAAKDRGFLWRIEKDGRTSHLFGSIHVNTLEWMFFGPKTMAAIRDANTIALEINPLDPEVQAALTKPPREGQKVASLSEAQRKRLDVLLGRLCAPAEALKTMHPAMQAMTAIVFDARFQKLEAAFGSELFLLGLAQGAKKPLVSLETAGLQLRAIVGENDTAMPDWIDATLSQLESGAARKYLARLHAAWGEGNDRDLERMESWCDCMNTESEKALMKRLNDDRNPGLAKGIDKLHVEGKNVFAAVGALHMFGPKGLPRLLAEMGYKVTRVSFDDGVTK